MANISITNSFISGTAILSAEVNTNFTDVSSYINARNGGSTDWDFVSSAGLITGKALFRANDGLISAPSYSFTSDIDSGMRLNTAGDVRFGSGGVDIIHFTGSEINLQLETNLNNNKIIAIAAGTAATDAVRFDQLKVIQTVVGTSTTEFTTTSSSFQSTNLSATITPTSSSNRILIIASSTLRSDDGSVSEALAGLSRGVTDLTTSVGQHQLVVVGATVLATPCTLNYIDSPATTSATTYRVRIRNVDSATTVRFGRAGGASQHMILMEVV